MLGLNSMQQYNLIKNELKNLVVIRKAESELN
jgi:hypothetical protein